MTDSHPNRSNKHGASARGARVVAAAILAVLAFLAVRYWMPDPGMTLAYLRVLVWPVVVVIALVAFRLTLLEKASELVKLSAYGVDAEFQREQAAQARTALTESALEDALEDADHPDGEPLAARDSDAERTDESRSDGDEVHNTADDASVAESEPEPSQGRPVPEAEGEQPIDTSSRLEHWLSATAESRATEAKRRASIEAAFKEGAAWGYDMAGIGLRSRPVPVIQWTAEGKPEIIYGHGSTVADGRVLGEVSESVARAKDRFMTQRLDSVRRLEQEIRELEIEEGNRILNVGGVANMGRSLGRRELLAKLKRELRELDPNSPYAH